jgi:predicted membrane-bound spermidine synthase
MATVPAPSRAASEKPARERSVSLALPATLVALSLFSSGAAGLVNQVVWQRSLKIFLGGSEAICSMVVVLVFMAGLGIGSIWMGSRAARLKNPLRTFGLLESILAMVNLAVCGLLAADLSHSVYSVQTLALSLGIPLLAVYAVGAILVLMIPCLLMGATMPLAAEAAQRNFGFRNARLLGLLLFVNTLGSVVGTVVASGAMIPGLGQARSLLAAAALNLTAGLVLLALALWNRQKPIAIAQCQSTPAGRDIHWYTPSLYENLALGLGFCSLGYEMFLLRLIPLTHQPLPFIFAAVLAGFLLFWSIGAALSSLGERPTLSTPLRLCALLVACSIPMYLFDSPMPIHDTGSLVGFIAAKWPYFLPCLAFGYLFGVVVRLATRSWGRDLGRIYAWNTVGSCLGVVAMTLVGYELPFYVTVVVIALLLYAMQEYALANRTGQPASSARRWAPLVAAACAAAAPFVVDMSGLIPGVRMYSGRDGVILIDEEGNMIWDGLWHSKLSNGEDHIGTNNWYLGVCPALCHPTGEIEDVCIIGVATGITASTLARDDAVHEVVGYDISHMLTRIHHDYPQGTLGLAENEKINIIWQDARTGLALSDRQFDIIQAQPLYLKQAGSSLLNSVEFYRLVQSRLKPGGVFCLYSNGTAEQALAVRQTADQVFAQRASFFDGYLVLLSDTPFDLSEEHFDGRLARGGALWREVRGWKPTSTGSAILKLLDRPNLPSVDADLTITDDWPVLEYPKFLANRVQRLELGGQLPTPQQGRTRD